MEPSQPGKKDMPDFKELHDRVIAEPSASPSLVIKTNLDPKSPKEDNLYYQSEESMDEARFEGFFEGK
ncbi:MAG: hypothetical protein ACE3JP_15255 [Ectobacillus sp.]